MAIGLAIKSFIDNLGRFVVGQSVRRRLNDNLGDRENRKRLAARAFLEGYEPDSRLFAKGPDDAPDVFMPEPLVEPVDTYLPPQPQVPQLVPAGVAAAPGEEVEYLVREVERINANVDAIALAMRANAEADSQYRQSIIQQQKDKIAQRGSARSKRRSKRARGVRNFLRNRAKAGRRRVVSTFEGMKPNLLAFAALESIDQIQKNFDNLVNMLPEQIRDILGLGTQTSQEGTGTTGAYQPSSRIPQAVVDDKDFTSGVTKLAEKYDLSEDDLYAVMDFETGGTFDPAKQNPKSKATGLIQFTPDTARGLGTSIEDLAKMSRAEQLEYVDKYLASKNIQGAGVEDLYMSVLLPAAVGKSDDFVLFGKGATVQGFGEGSLAYKQNKGLDLNNDGSITKEEAASKVVERLPTTQQVSSLTPVSRGSMSQEIAQLGEGFNILPPSYVDMRNQSQQLGSNSGAGSDFDVASVSLDPTATRSEYASMFGVTT